MRADDLADLLNPNGGGVPNGLMILVNFRRLPTEA